MDTQSNLPKQRSFLKSALDVTATVLVIAVCATVLWRSFSQDQARQGRPAPRLTSPKQAKLPTQPLELDNVRILGQKAAKVAIIQYSEFQCPYCGVFVKDTLPELTASYISTGKVLLAFRHFPLESIHPTAQKAAEAAECAGRQGRFWEMHNLMFADQRALPDGIVQMARALRLDESSFSNCLEGQAEAMVRADAGTGRTLGVTGTPTFFIGRVQADGRVLISDRFSGAQSAKRFKDVIDPLLAAAETTSTTGAALTVPTDRGTTR